MDNKQENTLRIQEHLLKTSHKYWTQPSLKEFSSSEYFCLLLFPSWEKSHISAKGDY